MTGRLRGSDLAANASAFVAAVLLGASVVAVRVAVRDIPQLDSPLALILLFLGIPGRHNSIWHVDYPARTANADTGGRCINLNPIVVAVLGVLLLSERATPVFLLSFVAVIGGVLLVNWPPRERAVVSQA